MNGPRYIDMPPQSVPVAPDDWIYTPAGSRYVVHEARVVATRERHVGCTECTPNVVRYGLKCTRLPKHTPIPADVRAIEFHSHRYVREEANRG